MKGSTFPGMAQAPGPRPPSWSQTPTHTCDLHATCAWLSRGLCVGPAEDGALTGTSTWMVLYSLGCEA